jgi:hypothetical protein
MKTYITTLYLNRHYRNLEEKYALRQKLVDLKFKVDVNHDQTLTVWLERPRIGRVELIMGLLVLALLAAEWASYFILRGLL